MFKKFTRIAVVGAAIAASTVGLISSNALAGPPLGPVSVGTASGTDLTVFTMLPPLSSACTGGASGSPSYRWQTYIVSASVDASTLTYGGAGPNAVAGAFVSPMYDGGGTPVINQNPAASPLGLITGIPTFSLGVLAGQPGLVNGAYKMGFACTLTGAIENGRYWETTITISNVTPTSFSYAVGAVPAAPALSLGIGGDQSFSVTNTHVASTPTTTGYTVTAVPGSGPTLTKSFPAGSTSFAFVAADGPVNGQTYAVTATAANSVGTSPVSNTVSVSPSLSARPAVTSLTATAGTGPAAGDIILTWVAPTGPAPTGYSITSSPALVPAIVTPTVGAGVLTFTVTTDPAIAYTFTVTSLHAAPFTALSASVGPISSNPDALIIQDISVTRPPGVLILTQRCGVNGLIPAEIASTGFPALPAIPASASQTGTSPLLTWPGGAVDPQFGNYPYPAPATYPTHCGINLGTATLVTSGPLSGNYYRADGIINQVTVLDTRDSDPGWTVTGNMSPFATTGDSFSGDFLGWSPFATDDSDPVAGVTTYDQISTNGAFVAPNTVGGLDDGSTLASAAPGVGLGIATMDARLKLLIPLSANAGAYTGTLTFTVA